MYTVNYLIFQQVTKILFDKNKRAIGVAYKRDDRTKILIAKKEVILSAGAIASPQLLLLSGVGPKEHLSKKGIVFVTINELLTARLARLISYFRLVFFMKATET